MDNIQITHECLKAVSNFGSTTYQNVCNGVVSSVPWGGVDWFMFIILGVIGIAILVLFIKIALFD